MQQKMFTPANASLVFVQVENLYEASQWIEVSNDISQTSSFVPAPTVNNHGDNIYGTHHARDAVGLFKTMDLDLNLFSSALKVNSQYMHVVWFNLELKEQTNKDKVLHLLQRDKRVALTEHHSTNTVFSFGRDQGQYGRILNQTVILGTFFKTVGKL